MYLAASSAAKVLVRLTWNSDSKASHHSEIPLGLLLVHDVLEITTDVVGIPDVGLA